MQCVSTELAQIKVSNIDSFFVNVSPEVAKLEQNALFRFSKEQFYHTNTWKKRLIPGH